MARIWLCLAADVLAAVLFRLYDDSVAEVEAHVDRYIAPDLQEAIVAEVAGQRG
jgi:hypothetical protein